ncbi:hypothetical protein HBI33_072860 [Parastagonospora nodorum]|nr:hypothetical protein HBI33_072860 [Parastagonospora nodorum]
MNDRDNVDRVEQAILGLRHLSEREQQSAQSSSQLKATLSKIDQIALKLVVPGRYLLLDGAANDSVANANRVEKAEQANAEQELTELIRANREHVAIINSKTVPLTQYLGSEYTKHIDKLHRPTKTSRSPELVSQLHDYQELGIDMLIELGNGIYKGGILGDPCGLGKTVQCIEASMRDRVPGWPDLVVTTKSCALQWKAEIGKHYSPDRQPKSLILNDPRTTANAILEGKYQFVIVTYNFVMSRYREYQKYRPFFDLVALLGMAEALELCSTPEHKHLLPLNVVKRSANALFSDVFEEVGVIWHHLILDEASFVKNTKSETHNAVRAIRTEKVWMASGTFLDNRWWDIHGLCAQLPGVHPFQDKRLFERAFAQKADGRFQDPSVSKKNRLVKWLQGFTICRPDTVLDLPGLKVVWWNFELADDDEMTVAAHAVKFIYALKMKLMQSTEGASALVEENGSAALMHAMRAQQICANPVLISQSDRNKQKKLLEQARDIIAELLKEWRNTAAVDEDAMEIDIDAGKGSNERTIDPRMDMILQHQFAALSDNADRVQDQKPSGKASDAPTLPDASSADIAMQDAGEGDTTAQQEDDGDVDDEGAGQDQEKDSEAEFVDTEVVDEKSRKIWLNKVREMTDREIFSHKVREVLECIENIVDMEQQDIVVFTTFLIKWAHKAGVEVLRFDGTTSSQERADRKLQFETKTTFTKIMLATPGAGGYGLELSTAQHVLQLEPWWNHNKERQAWSRTHRQGNLNPVTVWRFSASNSLIDSLFLAIAGKKTIVNESVMKYLRVPPGEKPRIPKQYSGTTGEY